ncbi:MAG: ABC transporter permease [Deltaproteobacteria bacterium]|nr:ABC transporter permease [Deltaproteobacteria bacterium]
MRVTAMARKTDQILSGIGKISLFTLQLFRILFRKEVQRQAVFKQMSEVTLHSLPITAVAGIFVGGIFALQFAAQMKGFGADGYIGGANTSAIVRNVGPLLVAFMLAGKIGAYTTAELGTMRVTDQIDALSTLGLSPLVYLIAPRFLAILAAAILLLIFSFFISTLGGMVICHLAAGINFYQYASKVPEILNFWSILNGVAKSAVFGLLIAAISCYFGYTASGGARGVGTAVNTTAVTIVVSLVVANYWVTSLIHSLAAIFGGQ